MSITELIVAIAITGIAVAGLTEISLISAEWIDKFTNGADSNIALKRALERVELDVKSASNFGDRFATPSALTPVFPATGNILYPGILPAGNPSSFQMSDETIFFQVPVFSNNGWPTAIPSSIDSLGRMNVDTIVYRIVPDLDPDKAALGEYVLQRSLFSGIHNSSIPNLLEKSSSSSSRTILTGIVGPINKSTGKVNIFQAIDELAPTGSYPGFSNVRVAFLPRIVGLVLNIQVRKAQRSVKNSNINSVRAELMIRNREVTD